MSWRQTVLPLVNRMSQGFSRWLGPHYFPLGESPAGSRPSSAGALHLRADLDAVEALSGERDALWARLNAATFLSEDEKRAAAGYGEKSSSSGAAKFNSYHDDAGRFTTADGAVPPGSGREGRVRVAMKRARG